MLTGFLAVLGAIPGIGSIVTFCVGKVFDAKVAIYQARTGASRDVAIATIQAAQQQRHENVAALSIFASNPLLTILLIAFATPFVVYIWQCVVWDKVMCPHFQVDKETADLVCQTDSIKGQIADWANEIIAFLFGAPTTLAVMKLWNAQKQ